MGPILTIKQPECCTACYSCMLACAREVHNSLDPSYSALKVLPPVNELAPPVPVICQACEQPACAEACPAGALAVRKDGGVELREKQCKGCGSCAHSCSFGVLKMAADQPIVCRHCGVCTRYCPRGVLAVEVNGFAASDDH
ncbi:MAG TPA: 4Fe-4S dicluster domain-containing protein [Bacillota bacterium]|nr:4Fe-4S dicluster domain-containing protein [Bacillota bacterium]